VKSYLNYSAGQARQDMVLKIFNLDIFVGKIKKLFYFYSVDPNKNVLVMP